MKLEPQFKHDCDKCTFVAPVHMAGKIMDVYLQCCEDEAYIMRYSDEESDYETVNNYNDSIFSSTSDGKKLYSLNFWFCHALALNLEVFP